MKNKDGNLPFRNGKKAEDLSTLTGQVSTLSSSLAEKATKVFITPEEFGAKGDGVTNDTTALQNAINNAITNNVLLMGKSGAVYGITSTIVVNGFINIDMSASQIKDISSAGLDKMINITQPAPSVYPTDYLKQQYFSVSLLGKDTTNWGIYGTYVRNMIIVNSLVCNVIKGIELVGGYEVTIRDFYGSGIAANTNSVGIKLVVSDCLVDNAILLDFHTGFWTAGSNYFENIHCWKSRNFNGSIAFRHEDGVCWLDNCYLDSYQYSIYKEQQTQLFITNLRTFFNTTLYTAAFNTPTLFYATNTGIDMFSYTSLTNSFIKSGVAGTVLSNLTNLIIKEKNNSYDYVGFAGMANMNRKDVTLGSGVTKGNFDNFCKVNDDTTVLRLNMYCAAGFVHNQRIGTVSSKPSQTLYFPCIVSDNAWVGSASDAATANQGVVVVDDTGGIYYYNLSGVPSRKYLFLTTTYNTKML